MVHTAEIIYETSNKTLIENIFKGFGFSKEQQDKLHQGLKLLKDEGFVHCSCSKAAYMKVGDIIPGLKYVSVRLMYAESIFKVTVRLEPNLLLTGKRSTDVFLCTDSNKEELRNIFYCRLGEVIGYDYPDILDLQCWLTKRIDYTHNIKLDSKDTVKTFEIITKRTNRNSYRSKSLRISDKKWDEQSTANGNKSSKNILYDKQQQIIDEYNGMPEDELYELIVEAEGIARFEVQCDKGKVSSLLATKADVRPESKSFMDFLNEPLAAHILSQRYADLVGWGDFYSLNAAIERVNESTFKKGMKAKLINFLRLASQSKSIATLRSNFLTGITLKKYTDEKGEAITLKGSTATYLSRVKLLNTLGINPMPIARSNGIDFFQNPMKPSDFNIMEA